MIGAPWASSAQTKRTVAPRIRWNLTQMSAWMYSMMWPMWKAPLAYGRAVVTNRLRGLIGEILANEGPAGRPQARGGASPPGCGRHGLDDAGFIQIKFPVRGRAPRRPRPAAAGASLPFSNRAGGGKRMTILRKPDLVCPAGSLTALKVAVDNGADA